MASMNRKARAGIVAALVVTTVAACDVLSNPLEVEPASRIPAETLEIPQNAQILSDGAVGDFECAFNSYVTQGGTIGDEFIYAQQTADRAPYDRRTTIPTDARYATNTCTALGVYTPVQIARSSNENILARLKSWNDADVAAGPGSPNRTNLMAIAAAYAGYSYILLGEGFCTMAVSTINLDKTITYGGEISRDSTLKLAIARFTEAIGYAQTAGNSSILNMAYLGRARAKLDLADYAGAKADALLVPSGYLRNVGASDSDERRRNRVWSENNASSRNLSVGPIYRAMSGDPRVPVSNGNSVSATGVPHFFQTKYPSSATPIPLAKYQEAQLIIAEANIRAGDLSGALPILNAERARGNQPAFTGTTQADYLAELIDQRRRELFAEGQHLGDMIRLKLPLSPAAGTPYHFGGVYGDQVCLPLPSAERLNNPLIGG
jgi:hypothetical protein